MRGLLELVDHPGRARAVRAPKAATIFHNFPCQGQRSYSVQNVKACQECFPATGLGCTRRCGMRLWYTCAAMSKNRPFSPILEVLLCAWIVGAQIWYLLQFRPLIAFFVMRFFHKS